MAKLEDYWYERASCRGLDTSMFFPEVGKAHFVEREIERVCGSCEVAKDCLDYALRNSIKVGYYGGLSGNKREQIKSLQRRNRMVA